MSSPSPQNEITVTPVGVPLLRRFKLITLLIRENGLLWTFICLVYSAFRYGLRCDIRVLQHAMRWIEERWKLPGMSSTTINKLIWNSWDWEKLGDEWTDTSEWKQAMLSDVLERYVPPGGDILEIGPGAGRWTEWLQCKARTLTLVDLSENCLAFTRKRFAECDNIVFCTTQGANLEAVPSETIDSIWSFDVFVHITPWDTESYLADMARVLRPGGRAILHHAKDGGLYGAWRSRMTKEMFAEMAARQGLRVTAQFDEIGEKHIPISPHHDTISIIEK